MPRSCVTGAKGRAVGGLKDENAALRDEIARLKERPRVQPSGMETATEPKSARAGRGKRRRGGKIAKLVIDEERVIMAQAPADWRFKGYETYVVQDLIPRPHVVRFRRERWVTPAGGTVVAR